MTSLLLASLMVIVRVSDSPQSEADELERFSTEEGNYERDEWFIYREEYLRILPILQEQKYKTADINARRAAAEAVQKHRAQKESK
jgi:hypothetical protein